MKGEGKRRTTRERERERERQADFSDQLFIVFSSFCEQKMAGNLYRHFGFLRLFFKTYVLVFSAHMLLFQILPEVERVCVKLYCAALLRELMV